MNQFNPLRCETEKTRRLSIALLGASLICWFAWVGVVSNGFRDVKPIGWLLLFGLPVAVFFVLLLLLPIFRRAKRETRLLLSACAVWVFSVGAWGFIAELDEKLSPERYAALFILPPVGVCFASLLWTWSNTSK